MKVILLQDVPNIGKENDIVEVSDGYAKNFLIKKKLAMGIDKSTLNFRQQKIDSDIKEHEEMLYNANLLKDKLETMELHFYLTSNHGKAFGSISNKAILEEINKNEKLIDKHMIADHYQLTLGPTTILINICKEVQAKVKAIVFEK